MLDVIIYPMIVLITSFLSMQYNFLLKMITMDSLFNAIHFLKTYINNNLSDSQIIVKSGSLYNGSLLDRYIYYIGIYTFYKISCVFIWSSNIYILYFLLFFSIIPQIINKILDSKLFFVIRETKEQFIKVIVSKIFAGIIKFYSKLYLDKDVNIKHTEIICLLKDYSHTISYFGNVLKNILIILGLSYIKNYSASVYYGIIKYIYNYKTGDMLISFNGVSARKCLINIIDNRKWNELTKPNTYKAILYLYQISSEKTDVFKNILNQFNMSLVKMFSVWTISSLINNIQFVPLLSILMVLYKKFIKKKEDDKFYYDICIKLISIMIGYFYNSYLVISALCHFGSTIIFNKITYILVRMIFRNIKKKVLRIIKNNKDLATSYVIISIYIMILRFLDITNNYLIIGLNMMVNILMNIEIRKQIIFGVLLISTYLSNFNPMHILFNVSVLYFVVGLIEIDDKLSFQDYFTLLIQKITEHFSTEKKYDSNSNNNNENKIIGYFLNNIYKLRYLIRNKIRKLFFIIFRTKDNFDEGKIELMDTVNESISYINTINNDDNSNNNNDNDRNNSYNNNSNTSKIKKSLKDTLISTFEDSVSYDDDVFELSDNLFIEAISVDDDNDNDSNKFTVTKNNIGYAIFNNYYK